MFIKAGLASCLSRQFKSAESHLWLLSLKMVSLRSQGYFENLIVPLPSAIVCFGQSHSYPRDLSFLSM